MSCIVGQTLCGNSSEYSILEFIGEGGFGEVAKCLKHDSEEIVAVKFLKDDPEVMDFAEQEVKMLKLISGMDPDRINVVKFLESFHYEEQPCLAFEMLPTDLFEVLERGRPLSLNGIRPIAKQMMVALDALQSMEIMHTDIKLDNIMIASLDMPVRVKLIDFGLACRYSEHCLGDTVQTLGFRAPEVFLGLPLTGAIDVWSLGSVLGMLYANDELFPSVSAYKMLKYMVGILGLPEDHLLRAGKHTHKYFTEEYTEGNEGQAEERKTWRLVTCTEYNRKNKAREKRSDRPVPNSLDPLLILWPLEDGEAEMEDRLVFVDFLKRVLHLDPAKRMTPSQALQHKFITMSHLSKYSGHIPYSEYVRNSRKMMGISLPPDQKSSSGSYQGAGATAETPDGSTAEKLVGAPRNKTLEELKACLLKRYTSKTRSAEEVPPPNCPDGETTHCPQEKAAETPVVLTEETSDGPTEEAPDGSTVETLDGSTVETPDGPTVETPDGPTVETPDGSTVETPDGPTVETPDGPTVETPDGPTVETPDGPSEETPLVSTEETPDGPTVETLVGAPGNDASEELKASLPQNYKDNTPSAPPEDVLVSETSNEELPSSSAEHTDSPSRPSTSFRNRAMKRIRRFFRRVRKAFCCCCQVEDD